MADTLQTIALIQLGQQIRPRVIRTINRRSVMLRSIPIVAGAGKNMAWDVETSGMVVENFAEGADAANFGSDATKQALLNWGRVRANFHISGSARRAAKTNQAGPQDYDSLLRRNLENSLRAGASKVNAQLFSGDGTGDSLTGLDAAIGSTTNTYAGLDRTDVNLALWKPLVSNPGVLTPPSFKQVRDDLADIYTNSGETPDLMVADPKTFSAYQSLFDPNKEFEIDVISTARGDVRLDSGAKAIMLEGVPLVRDKDATANTLYYLNTNYIELQYLPLEEDVVEALMSEGLSVPADDGYGQIPLGFRCELLAKTGDSSKFQNLTECQLKIEKPNSMGVRKNIQIT